MRVFTLAVACSVLVVACSSNKAAQPPAPTGLVATGGNGQISLTWTAVPGATSYNILRGTAAATEAPLSPPATSTAAAYPDTGLAPGTTYFYVVQANSNAGTSANSNEASAVTAPSAPAGLTVTTTDSSATLQWTASQGAINYTILRAPGGTTTFTSVGTTATTSASDSGLTPNTPYVYAVSAQNASGTSANATVNATTAPVPPTGLTASASNHHVTLSWTAAAGAGSGGYRVLRSATSGGPYSSIGTSSTTSYTDTFLTNGSTYYYVVHTIGGAGESSNSNQTTGAPFIEICALDSASNDISVYNGKASGNVAPLRSFGWQTGIAEGTGIGIDGANVYIASRYSGTVNVYPRTVAGNTAPTSTLSLLGAAVALAVDTANHELYVAVEGPLDTEIRVYATSATSPPLGSTPLRTLTVGGHSVTGLTVSPTQLGVLRGNVISVFNRTTLVLMNTIQPASPVTVTTKLYGGAYDATDNTFWIAYTTFSGGVPTGAVASYLTTANGPADSIVKSVVNPGPANPMQFPRGVWQDGTNVWVSVMNTSQRNADVIYFFTRATGVLVNGIGGPSTLIYQPGAMAFDSANLEQWVLNGSSGALAFRKADINNVAPRHKLDGASTGVFDPVGIAADRGSDELVVLNRAPSQSITVYPRSLANATPSRTISGAGTTLDTNYEYSIAVDSANGEYWVNESLPALVAFSRTQNGPVPPVRTLSGNTRFDLGSPVSLAFDGKAIDIVSASQSATVANQGALQAWHRLDSGDVASARSAALALANMQLQALSIDLAHDELFSSDGATTAVFPRVFASGALSPLRTFTVPGLPVVDPEGDEIYLWTGNSVGVYSRTSTGAPTAIRTIAGSATQLYKTQQLAICN
jgi:fibronectin type 3 domain-containing protein